ncbi:MAG: type II secretion system protein [Rhizomicrobium sp.]
MSRTGERGFTLLEVLVALTILSLSLGVLLAIFSQSLSRAEENATEASARTLAHSLLAQAEAAPHPAFGDTNGVSNGLRWRVRIAPYGSDADQTAWQHVAQQLDATVNWQYQGRTRSLTLSSLRLNGATGTSQ